MKSGSSGGFTLIELLVVIAIIGVLSAVVLASLNTARSKGNDAAIQSNLSSIRSQSELYFDGLGGNKYGANVALESDCAAADNMFSAALSESNIYRAVAAADDVNGPSGTVTCNVSAGGTAYAVFAQLVVDSTTYWCIDSTSVGKVVTAAQITAAGDIATLTSCP
jgi:prepilin-type N-terminal cleavage/methylation domain-containing protein